MLFRSEQADLLQPQNRWTIRRLAHCMKRTGDYANALIYYQNYDKLSPDNVTITLQIGHCQTELKLYDEAIATYFKADYLSPNTTQIRRVIAWSYLLAGKANEACKQYDMLLTESSESSDYLNAAHAQWVIGKTEKAMSLYRTSLRNAPTEKQFFTAFLEDKKHLLKLGISEQSFSLWYDALHYN